MPARVLVVDDDSSIREFVRSVLSDAGFEVDAREDGAAALASIDVDPPDLVLSDLRMPELDGLELLRRVRERHAVPFVLMTSWGGVDDAVEAVRAGADDFLQKPLSPELLLARIDRTLERTRLRERVRVLERERSPLGIVAASPSMARLVEKIPVVARSGAPVLLLGESGTGKELFARELHARSDRSSGPFVAVNCGAIPENLMESELFGHRRGAFTGAERDRSGLLVEADHGTLLLDEVGDLPAPLQVKLLRALEDQEIRPVGGQKAMKVDVRVISATNADLDAAVAAGRFRRDLLHRINTVTLRIPPLRERPEDVVALAERFVRSLGTEHGKPGARLSSRALDRLRTEAWPGNVRELRNRIFEALLYSKDGVLDGDSFGSAPAVAVPTSGGAESLDDARGAFERRWLTAALERAAGNVAKVAAEAGLSRRGLYNLLERHGLDPGSFRGSRADA